MKKILFILTFALLLLAINVKPQVINKTMTGTPATVKNGGTATFTMATNSVPTYSGVVGFQYTFTTDTLNTVLLQGTIAGSSNWVTVTTETTKVAGTYSIFDETPNYTTYRLYFSVGSDDSLIVTEVKNIYKEK